MTLLTRRSRRRLTSIAAASGLAFAALSTAAVAAANDTTRHIPGTSCTLDVSAPPDTSAGLSCSGHYHARLSFCVQVHNRNGHWYDVRGTCESQTSTTPGGFGISEFPFDGTCGHVYRDWARGSAGGHSATATSATYRKKC